MGDIRNKIGLGTVQFGMEYGISNQSGQTPPNEVSAILASFRKKGGNLIDTAIAYGSSEIVLGNAGVGEFSVISKFMPPARWGTSVEEQLAFSLERLKVEKLYGYLAHRTDDLILHPRQWEILKECKEKGLIDKAGVSLSEPGQWDKLKDLGIYPDIIQVPYNYFDRRFEPVMRECRQAGGEIHTRSAFLQGLFFREPDSLPGFFDEIKQALAEIQRNRPRLHHSLLSFVLRQPFTDYVITGVETEEQLLDNYSLSEEVSDLPELTLEISEDILNPANWIINEGDSIIVQTFDLSEKTIIITGGYGHLGKAVTESLVYHGGTVFVLARSKEEYLTAFSEHLENGKGFLCSECDISDTSSGKSAFQKIADQSGDIDVLSNNAFYLTGQDPVSMTDE